MLLLIILIAATTPRFSFTSNLPIRCSIVLFSVIAVIRIQAISNFNFEGLSSINFTSLWWLPNNYMGSCIAKPEAKDNDSDDNVEFATGNVKLITSKEAWDQKLEEAKTDGKIVIGNFSAAWCGPCKMIAPYYGELSEKYSSMMFLLVDVDELTDFSTSLDIKATPTFFFIKDGQQVDKLVGANKPELQKKIVAITNSAPQHQ